MLKEFQREAFIRFVVSGEFQRYPHQVEAEHSHPASRIGLLQHSASGQFLAPVNNGDIVQPEKPTLKNVIAGIVNLVNPPRKVDEQFMEALFQKLAVPVRDFSMLYTRHTAQA